MAKKKQDAPIAADHNIITQSMEEVVHSSMIPFAEYVILERALPRVEDGLKPVQRRILFTMMEMNVLPDRPYRKSARIVGDCMGKYLSLIHIWPATSWRPTVIPMWTWSSRPASWLA